MTIEIAYAVQTSLAAPSQWDAWDAEGRYYYLRYRYGHGQARHYRTRHWVDSDYDELVEVVADFHFGDPLDGFISLAEFCEHAGIQIAENFTEASYGEHFRDEMVQHGMTELIDFPEEE